MPATERQFQKLGKNPKDPINFQDADLVLSRGYVYERAEHFEEAIFEYKKYLRQKKDDAWVTAHLGYCLKETMEFQTAMKMFDKA